MKQTIKKRSRHRRAYIRVLAYVGTVILLFYSGVACCLFLLRWIAPPTTAVQVERRLAAWREHRPYKKRCEFVPLPQISPELRHAVIAAEDTRFFHHHGFDWQEVEVAVHEGMENGRRRGASTITQQLVRNLFLNTEPSLLRKGIEFSLVPFAEAILPKRRILELYLNEIEWGPGVYGAEAASEVYFRHPARRLTREEGAELASMLPAPLKRKPAGTQWYAEIIEQRMRTMGW